VCEEEEEEEGEERGGERLYREVLEWAVISLRCVCVCVCVCVRARARACLSTRCAAPSGMTALRVRCGQVLLCAGWGQPGARCTDGYDATDGKVG